NIADFESRVANARATLPKLKQKIDLICKINDHFSKFDRSTLEKMIEDERIDAETLRMLYELNLLSLQPVLKMEINRNIEIPYYAKMKPLIWERRRLQQDRNQYDSTLQALAQSKYDRPRSQRLYQEVLENRAQIQEQINSVLQKIAALEEERDKLVHQRIKTWSQGERTVFMKADQSLEFDINQMDTDNLSELDDKSAGAGGADITEDEIASQNKALGNAVDRILTFDEAKSFLQGDSQVDPNETNKFRKPVDVYRVWLNRIANRLSMEMGDLLMMQARTRLDSITLDPVEITAEEAFIIAEENRLDWMNRRAALVDSWRNIEIAANSLKSVLDMKVNGSIGTTNNNPVNFDQSTGNLSVGLAWDAPLTRVLERNAYRKALIDYQRARRDYYTYVDGVQARLLDSVRTIQISQLNFEIQRATIFTTINSVEQAQLNLEKPSAGRSGGVDSTATRDLLDSLSRLLSGQNTFMTTWVSYLTQKMRLELDMGVLKLDSEGMWIESQPVYNKSSLRLDDPDSETAQNEVVNNQVKLSKAPLPEVPEPPTVQVPQIPKMKK
ncbi:MAG: hypothetical protein ACRC2T_13170, partial [Thermoguttaceae bacterium]